ncbi:MAG: hypothetical protein MJ211_07315 [Bacteroidales bacterium]|nr:hypothetical protein [Bacteroidales bacterium]
MNIIFIIALIAVVFWALSFVIRNKNNKLGSIFSWIAIILLVIALILKFVL